ncbi:MAG: ABC transporter substrate-binding protein [Nitrospirae bacterium]|nr:ABC transporter substrate-binding protein [Nitrospirota bacterium]
MRQFSNLITVVITSVVSILMLFCGTASPASGRGQRVVLQLKWLHQFQFAGYYAALEKGYYQEAGLDVKIVEGGPNIDVTKEVEMGHADYGVGTSGLLIDRSAGKDFVVLGVVFQHSPAVLLSTRKSGIRSISDIAGKRLMDTPGSQDIDAMLKKAGIDYSRLHRVTHKGNPADLINDKADMMVAYSTNEPFVFEQKGEPYVTFSPRALGIDFYGDNFFTTSNKVDKQPEQVSAFREATIRGWYYALSNKTEIVELILEKYSRKKSKDALMFEAVQSEALIQADLVDLGYQSQVRWQHIAKVYAELGMMPHSTYISGIVYDPRRKADVRKLWITISVFCVISLALGFSAFVFLRLNRRLRSQISEHRHVQGILTRNDIVKSHVARISIKLQKCITFEELSYKFLSLIAPLIGVEKGTVYIFDKETEKLTPYGGYGYMGVDLMTFSLGDGLVGQCAKGRIPIVLSSPEESALRINLAMADIAPRTVILLPIIQHGRLLGVIELASVNLIDEERQSMLNELMPVVAINLEILLRNLHTQYLLEETSKQSKELLSHRDQLKATELWYRSIIESAPDGMLVVDEQGTIILANHQLDDMFGYNRGDLAGQKIEVLVPPDIAVKHVSLREHFIRSNDPGTFVPFSRELRGFRRDGSEFPVEVGFAKLPALAGQGCSVCAAVRDITQRKHHENALAKERKHLQHILDTAPVGIVISEEGVAQYANPRATELVCAKAGVPVIDFYVRSSDRLIVLELLGQHGVVRDFDVQMFGPNGVIRDIELTLLPIEDNGRSGILAWIIDVTGRKRVEEIERFNRLATGREERIIELKKKILPIELAPAK